MNRLNDSYTNYASSCRGSQPWMKNLGFQNYLDLALSQTSSCWVPFKVAYGPIKQHDRCRGLNDIVADYLASTEETEIKFMDLIAAPSRDFFFSLAVDELYSFIDRWKTNKANEEQMGLVYSICVQLLFVAIHLNKFAKFSIVTERILHLIKTADDLPKYEQTIHQLYYDVYFSIWPWEKDPKNPNKPKNFWGGESKVRFSPSGFDWFTEYYYNKENWDRAIGNLFEILDHVNCHENASADSYDQMVIEKN
mmetsp:Transcript_19772/g.34758  ORF Transcript_19772/g.34758 Transcript_19772/m.34758 type:complete len:251 (-) Transcript_19772:12-764(-)